MERTIIALQTDFGLKDHYVGTMKGTMLSIWPHITFVDLGHESDAFRIIPAAYTLFASWEHFPEKTIFVSVVDPGVGTSRQVLFGKIAERILVTPDNGSAGFLVRMFGSNGRFARPDETILDRLRQKASATFHGRDIFGPLAALCARDGFESITGEACTPIMLPGTIPALDNTGREMHGMIVSIDRFGNCITSIHTSDLEKNRTQKPMTVSVGGTKIGRIRTTFSDVEWGEPLAYIGSAGFIEIGVREKDASKRFGLTLGDPVTVLFH
jgi:S-adenosylmethionine hydrolase